jgi:hypothetical protein
MYSDPDCSHCFSAIKRWDSIAFHEFCELHPDFLSHFNCELTGGVGGVQKPSYSSSGTVAASSVSKTSKTSIRRQDLADESQKRFIQELVTAIKPVSDPQVHLTQELLQVSSTLRELVASNDSDDDDLINHYKKRKSELRYEVRHVP